jgi:hypothetical protein
MWWQVSPDWWTGTAGGVTKMTARVLTGALVAVACSVSVLFAQSVLSEAQKAVIEKKTESVSKTEKAMIEAWPVSKKLAEFFCSPAGLAAIKKQHAAADRLFLGPDDEGVKKFVVVANTKLSGRGSVRLGADWKDFSFVCTLDPDKGTATGFTFTLDK